MTVQWNILTISDIFYFLPDGKIKFLGEKKNIPSENC